MNLSEPIGLQGYEMGIRTVHFSQDNSFIYGDYEHIVKWDRSTGEIVSKTPIPGYNIYKSIANSDLTLWMQANVNYNTDKKDIGDTHPNLNVWQGGDIKSFKMPHSLGEGVFIPGTRDVILIFKDKQQRYGVMRYNLDIHESSTIYFKESNDLKGVPTAVDVFGGMLAVSVGEGDNGVYFYNVSTGNAMGNVKFEKNAYDGTFTAGGNRLIVATGTNVVEINVTSKVEVSRVDTKVELAGLDIDSEGNHAVCRGIYSGAYLVDINNGSLEKKIFDGRIFDITVSDNDEYVALGVQKSLMMANVPSIILFENLDYQPVPSIASDNPGLIKEEVSDTWQVYAFNKFHFAIELPDVPKATLTDNAGNFNLSSGDDTYKIVSRALSKKLSKKKKEKRLVQMAAKFKAETGGKSISSSRINIAGLEAWQEIIDKDGIRIVAVFVVSETRSYKITYTNSKGVRTDAEKRFFDSFETF